MTRSATNLKGRSIQETLRTPPPNFVVDWPVIAASVTSTMTPLGAIALAEKEESESPLRVTTIDPPKRKGDHHGGDRQE
jgi:hypothetical protein